QVFLFFANPQNLPLLMPPQTETRVEQLRLFVPPPNAAVADSAGLAGVGSEIVTSFRVLPWTPIRVGWTARITEFEWNHCFADVQKQGPFRRFQHRHEFAAKTRDGQSGTTVRDLVEYEVGFGWLGGSVDQWQVPTKLAQTFRHRQTALVKLLTSGASG